MELLKYAKGTYQESILLGLSRWSGSDLLGKAGRWGGKYAKSRASLVARLQEAGHQVEVKKQINANRRWMTVLYIDGIAVSATK